ncbi:MAG: response regulator [Prolixibacteraceae bacterium]|nr:response regulator [Prolixibacteraceae bacterium]
MKKALIVDDIKENLYLLGTLLKAYGYKTVAANNGAEALGLALKDPPDIIIADILMPVMDGYTLCREWKKEKILKNIPFVFYTATYTHPKDEEFALSLGAEKFIIKPQEPEDFIAVIEKVLAEFRTDEIQIREPSESSEITMLKEYNETLIRKMEERMLKSEDAEKKIRIYAAQLETEIEQRKRVAQALKESEILFRSVVENAAEGFSITDETGKIIVWNNAMEGLTGIPAHEIIGKFAWDLQFIMVQESQRTDELKENFRKITSEFLVTGNSPFAGKLMERQYEKPDGTEVYLNGRVIPIKTDKGFILVSTVHDITNRKKNEEKIKTMNEELELKVLQRTAQLEATNNELESFSYSVSHDLRAPLRSIDGFSQALTEDYFSLFDDRGKDYLNRIWSSSKKMTQLIDAMLNLARVTRAPMNISKVNLSAMAQSILDEIGRNDPERVVEIIIEPNLIQEADATLIKAVLQNYFENAWKFTSHQPVAKIEFGLKVIQEGKAYFIRDNGVGFNMEYSGKLFAPFQRLHDVSEFAGTGIGLATVQRIIHRHNGRVWAGSEVNQGATFYFTFGL